VSAIDLRKQYRELYAPPRRPVLVDVPELSFVMVDGEGEPETSEAFHDSMGALFGIVYTVKFLPKKRPDLQVPDWKVAPLEGLWFGEGQTGLDAPQGGDAGWVWTVMIAVPDFITEDLIDLARDELRRKGKGSEQLDALRLERYHEGLSVQTMHVGPYDQETETIAAMHEWARGQGYEPHGRHHEIYLGDPRRTAPERLKTVIRQPVKAMEG